MAPYSAQNGLKVPPKKKKKVSKSERKRRKRAKERALAGKSSDEHAPESTIVSTKTKNEDSSEITTKMKSAEGQQKILVQEINTSSAKADALKLVNEASMTSRRVAFVYPKADKQTPGGKSIFYVHSKLRKAKVATEEEGKVNDDEELKKQNDLGDESIEDILFPARRNSKKEAPSKKKDKIKQKELANKKESVTLLEKENVVQKEEKKKELKAEIHSPKALELEEESYHNEEKKDADQPEERSRIKRSRSDSLSDPMKSRLSGRTVEDAIKDKSGRRPRSNSTDGELKLPKRGLCDERMVIRNYKWDLDVFKRAPPRGFINLGNTCFLNSTLQCLAYLPTFCQCVATLPIGPNGGSGQKKKNGNSGHQITMFLRNLLRKVHGLDGDIKQVPLAPKSIVRSISSLGGSHRGYKFRPGRQEDAHEFLVHLLDAMNNGELKAAGIDQNKSGWRDRLPIPRLDETTLTHRMFGGYLRSQVRCTKCKYKSNTYDPFLDLSLEVSGKKIKSLQAALSEYTRKETLDAANKWKCSGCKKHVCPTKQLTIFRPPLTLCIQLKRFSFGGGFGGFMHYQGFGHFAGKGMGMKGGSKVQKQIEFPSTLKLPLSDGRKCEYLLTGVVVHIGGSATSGHYTAFVRRSGKQGKTQWLNMDDSFVETVSEKTVLRNKDAYVLFYCRKEVQLDLPALPPRSFATAEDAVKAGQAKSRARAASITKEKETLTTSPKSVESDIVENSVVLASTQQEKVAGSLTLPTVTNKQKETTLSSSPSISPSPSLNKNANDTAAKIEKKAKEAKVKDTKHIASSSSEDEEESLNDIPTSKSKGIPNIHESKQDVEETSAGSDVEKLSKPLSPSTEKKAMASKKEKKDKKNITLDLGARGKVKVVLGRLKKKKSSWKPAVNGKSRNDQVGCSLLGNRVVSGWGDDDDGDDTAPKNAKAKAKIKKAVKLREKVFQETKLKEKSRKRKMYLDSWDAGLDSGKTKKIKEKQPTWESEMPKENPFHRIQEGMLKMKHGPKGHRATSMKKRRKLTK